MFYYFRYVVRSTTIIEILKQTEMTKTDKQKCQGYYAQALDHSKREMNYSQDGVHRTSRGVTLLYESYHRKDGWVVILNARKGLSETIYWKVVNDFEDSLGFIKEMESKR
jgi:hypothetical protein